MSSDICTPILLKRPQQLEREKKIIKENEKAKKQGKRIKIKEMSRYPLLLMVQKLFLYMKQGDREF